MTSEEKLLEEIAEKLCNLDGEDWSTEKHYTRYYKCAKEVTSITLKAVGERLGDLYKRGYTLHPKIIELMNSLVRGEMPTEGE